LQNAALGLPSVWLKGWSGWIWKIQRGSTIPVEILTYTVPKKHLPIFLMSNLVKYQLILIVFGYKSLKKVDITVYKLAILTLKVLQHYLVKFQKPFLTVNHLPHL